MSALGGSSVRRLAGTGARRSTRRSTPPLEHRILLTATLCLLAFGAVMVYSASSAQGVIESGGYGTGEFFTYLIAAALGLVAMRICERRGLELLSERRVGLLLMGAFLLLLAVLVPGVGLDVNGARRWFSSGPLEFQPSEIMKVAIVLYLARYLADHPKRLQRGFRQAVAPVAVVVVPACLLIAVEPDLGTTLVVAATVLTLLIAAGMPSSHLLKMVGAAVAVGAMFVIAEPYQMARLTSFLNPAACARTSCYQAAQAKIALGSGGLFGVGLGKSVAKAFYLPEAQSDFILAIVGDELGLVGVFGLLCLYGLIAYAGLRTARRAGTRYAKLLASGLTSLILCQGIINIFVVLGIAPLTGVPLPFISYAPTSLCMMLVAVGLLLNIARPSARSLRSIDGNEERSAAERLRAGVDDARAARDERARRAAERAAADRDRRRRDRGTRRPGAGGRRRAAG
jgi:cell division protein FtsW